MTIKAHRGTMDQLELFHRPPSRPTWSELPESVRTEARKLLAQLLRESVDVRTGTQRREEATND